MTHLVQAEFFNVDTGPGQTLGALMRSCVGRMADGLVLARRGREAHARIKTVVRFYDTTGELAELVQRFGMIREYQDRLSEELACGSDRADVLGMRGRQLAGQSLALHQQALRCAVRSFREIVSTAGAFAVGKQDHHFRLAMDDERHELLEAIEKSSRLWLFVFECNQLLSDQNVAVGRMM